MDKIYIRDIMNFGPCPDWTEERLQALDPDNKGLTPLEICESNVDCADKLWVLLRPEIIPEKVLHELSCIFAERALLRERELGREPNAVLWEAIEAKKKWLKGKIDDKKLRNKYDAAAYVAYVANTAYAAAAANTAVNDAVYAAAYAAYAVYATYSINTAAYVAEKKAILEIVKNVFKKIIEDKQDE